MLGHVVGKGTKSVIYARYSKTTRRRTAALADQNDAAGLAGRSIKQSPSVCPILDIASTLRVEDERRLSFQLLSDTERLAKGGIGRGALCQQPIRVTAPRLKRAAGLARERVFLTVTRLYS